MFQQSRGEYVNKECMLRVVRSRLLLYREVDTVFPRVQPDTLSPHQSSAQQIKLLDQMTQGQIFTVTRLALSLLRVHITFWHPLSTFPSWRVNPSLFPTAGQPSWPGMAYAGSNQL